MSEGWHTAYVAVSAALGEPLDAALGSLAGPLQPGAQRLAHALRSESRGARVRALAQALSPLALAVEAMAVS